jgi:hypothetical protein
MDEQVVKILLSVLLAIVSGAISIGTYYLKKYLNEKYSKEELARIKEVVMAAVRAAEMIGATMGWAGEEKKQWVIERLSGLLKIDEKELEVFIEAAVVELKIAGEEFVKVEQGGIVTKGEAYWGSLPLTEDV